MRIDAVVSAFTDDNTNELGANADNLLFLLVPVKSAYWS
jgi:hypothetical protein